MSKGTLRTRPWVVSGVFQPIEATLNRIRIDGTVESAAGRTIAYDPGVGKYFDFCSGIRGLVAFFDIAKKKKGWERLDMDPLSKVASKLHYGTPLFDQDIARAFMCIEQAKQYMMMLTTKEAGSFTRTVQIMEEMGVEA